MNPVILIHGIWDSSKKMSWIAADLRKAGRDVHLIDLYPSDGRLGVVGMAGQFKNFVEERQLEKFDIVAFSMGGIVAKYYIAELEDAEKVEKFATISTPHHGTV